MLGTKVHARSDKLCGMSYKLSRLILKRRNVLNLCCSTGLLFRQWLCRKESPIMTIIPLEGTRLWKYWSDASSDSSALTNTSFVMSCSCHRSQTVASMKLLMTEDAFLSYVMFVWYVLLSDKWYFVCICTYITCYLSSRMQTVLHVHVVLHLYCNNILCNIFPICLLLIIFPFLFR